MANEETYREMMARIRRASQDQAIEAYDPETDTPRWVPVEPQTDQENIAEKRALARRPGPRDPNRYTEPEIADATLKLEDVNVKYAPSLRIASQTVDEQPVLPEIPVGAPLFPTTALTPGLYSGERHPPSGGDPPEAPHWPEPHSGQGGMLNQPNVHIRTRELIRQKKQEAQEEEERKFRAQAREPLKPIE